MQINMHIKYHVFELRHLWKPEFKVFSTQNIHRLSFRLRCHPDQTFMQTFRCQPDFFNGIINEKQMKVRPPGKK